ncbi:MAG TPA: hypothetical protein VE422_47890 [Terriglobia bacterium]|nr:hypothetical protein [Terriglobia bacterium]
MKAIQPDTKMSKWVSYVTILALAAGWIIGFGADKAQAQTKPFEALSIGRVTALGGLSNDSPVRVVGQEVRDGRSRAFLFRENQFGKQSLPFGPGDSATTSDSIANDISPTLGEVVGESNGFPTDWVLPCAGCNPIASSVGHYPEPQGCTLGAGTPVAVNDSRVSVGSCRGTIGPGLVGDKPVRWVTAPGAVFTAAELPANPMAGVNGVTEPTAALDVSNSGVIVGRQGFTSKAVVWTSPDQPPLVFGSLREARGISNGSVFNNNPDMITMVGTIDTSGRPQERGVTFGIIGNSPFFLGITRLPFTYFGPNIPIGTQYFMQPFVGVETRKINRVGTTAGAMVKRNNGGTVAAIWNMIGQFADLTANTTGLPDGTVLFDAVDINDQGYVLAKGLVNGQLQGFLLRPTGVTIPFTYGQFFY